MRSCEFDKARGRINADDAAGRRDRGNSGRDGAGPGTDVEDDITAFYLGELHEGDSDFAAPPAHEPFVRVAC